MVSTSNHWDHLRECMLWGKRCLETENLETIPKLRESVVRSWMPAMSMERRRVTCQYIGSHGHVWFTINDSQQAANALPFGGFSWQSFGAGSSRREFHYKSRGLRTLIQRLSTIRKWICRSNLKSGRQRSGLCWRSRTIGVRCVGLKATALEWYKVVCSVTNVIKTANTFLRGCAYVKVWPWTQREAGFSRNKKFWHFKPFLEHLESCCRYFVVWTRCSCKKYKSSSIWKNRLNEFYYKKVITVIIYHDKDKRLTTQGPAEGHVCGLQGWTKVRDKLPWL